MGPRQFIRLIGEAAAWPRAEQADTLPDGAVGDSVQKEEDFPLIIANLPATGRQKAIAVGVAVLLFVAAAIIAPFANIQLGQVDAFIPVLQTALSIADFVTATLLLLSIPSSLSVPFSRSQAVTCSAVRSRSCRRWPFRVGTPTMV